jgi:hypothetical protein
VWRVIIPAQAIKAGTLATDLHLHSFWHMCTRKCVEIYQETALVVYALALCTDIRKENGNQNASMWDPNVQNKL